MQSSPPRLPVPPGFEWRYVFERSVSPNKRYVLLAAMDALYLLERDADGRDQRVRRLRRELPPQATAWPFPMSSFWSPDSMRFTFVTSDADRPNDPVLQTDVGHDIAIGSLDPNRPPRMLGIGWGEGPNLPWPPAVALQGWSSDGQAILLRIERRKDGTPDPALWRYGLDGARVRLSRLPPLTAP